MDFASLSAGRSDERWTVLTLALGIGANAAIFGLMDREAMRSRPTRPWLS